MGVSCLVSASLHSTGFSPAVSSSALIPSGGNKKSIRRLEEKNWNLTGTSQFIDRADEVIKDANELKALEDFITQKVIFLK